MDKITNMGRRGERGGVEMRNRLRKLPGI